MKKLSFSLWIVCLLCLVGCRQTNNAMSTPSNQNSSGLNVGVPQSDNTALIQAFQSKKSNVFVEGTGVVKKLLPEDNKGLRHQKFLVTITPEQVLLFAHNVDLAPSVPLAVGDIIRFRGEYVYNPKGGIMHWTHHDPEGGSKNGWIEFQGKKYQ